MNTVVPRRQKLPGGMQDGAMWRSSEPDGSVIS
jgi:hypothetical protein